MKIGLLAPEVMTIGGVQTFMQRIIDVLDNLSYQKQQLFALSLNDEDSETGIWNNVMFKGASRSKLRYLKLAYDYCKKTDYLIVGHVGQAPLAWLLKRIGLVSQYGVVLHGIEAWEQLPGLKRLALKSADRMIATTQYTADTCANKNGLDKSKIKVIPLCIKNGSQQLSDFKLKGKFKLLCVGRQSNTEHGKGYHMLFDAMSEIVKKQSDIHLNMIGDGDQHAQLIEQCNAKGLGSNVTFWGSLVGEDLQAAYKECDVFVLPSRKEGFGIVFLEAMRWAKPCIGGNHGGTPEVIKEGESGFLIDFDDTATLIRRIKQLVTDPAYCKAMGDVGGELVKEKYSFQSFSKAFTSLMPVTSLINKKHDR